MTIEVRASCHRFSWEMKTGSTILNPNPSSNRWSEAVSCPQQGRRNSRVCCQLEKLWLVFWDEKGVILVNFLPRGTTVNSDRYIKTPRNPNTHLCQVRPTRKMSEVLLLCHSTRPSQSLDGQCCHIHHSPDFAPSDYHLFCPSKKNSLRGHITPMMRHCRTVFISGCRERTATSTRWQYMRLFKVREDCWQKWWIH
jgi:hypothetical protein